MGWCLVLAFVKRFWILGVIILAGEGLVVAVLRSTYVSDPGEPQDSESPEEEVRHATVMYGTPITVVANPQGTRGLRFLIVTFDLYLDDPLTVEVVTEEKAQIHDAVLRLLGSKSVEALQRPGAVSVLKLEMAEAITGAMSSGICYDTCIQMLLVQ